MVRTVHVRASDAQVRKALSLLPKIVSGSGGHQDLVRALLVRVGLTALGRIKQAFVVKARGGTDESGLRWQPLSPATIAYSRRHPIFSTKSMKARRLPGSKARAAFRPSYQLTRPQRERWWQVYRQQLARFKGDKERAAAFAWTILKSEGATTLLLTYGFTRVEILRDTGLLFNSLSPGLAPDQATGDPPRRPNQVFRLGRGYVIIGTSRKWASTHHNGVPGKIPQRRLWPEPARWPASWWADILTQAREGLIDIALILAGGARP